jgi:tripartite-type tricarboxylate transporter receptor subunit TctC
MLIHPQRGAFLFIQGVFMRSFFKSVRRLFCGLGWSLMAVTCFAQAGDYPSKPVTVIVPFAAGGSVDSAARVVLQGLSDRLKQSFVVENVAGASGTIGTLRAARAPADGYTLVFAVASPINVAPVVKPSIVKYEALKDLVPIGTAASSPFVLIASPKLAVASVADLVAMAKKEPGKLNYGTDGVGTSMHLTAEIIKLNAGIDVVHVPYKNGPQVLTELAGGTLELAVMPVSLAQPFIRDGKVRALGVTSRNRWPSLPQVPAIAETAGLQKVDEESWYGLLAPAGTPSAVLDRLTQALRETIKDPAVVEKMNVAGLKPMNLERQDFAAMLQREREGLQSAVKAAGIKPE